MAKTITSFLRKLFVLSSGFTFNEAVGKGIRHQSRNGEMGKMTLK